MEGQRIFSVEEANELVPLLSLEFERIHRLRRLVGDHFEILQAHGIELDPAQPLDVQEVPKECRAQAARLVQMVRQIGSSIERMNEAGCLVKDLDVGLVDFYSVVDGEPVFLCWQYGEPDVSHFHGLNEGFRARKKLEGEKRSGVVYN